MKPGHWITFTHNGEEITGQVVRAMRGPVINGVLLWQVELLTEEGFISQYTVSDEGWFYASYAA